MQVARVVLDKASQGYDRIYDYKLPLGLHIAAGCRVIVPFGKGNARRLAFVMEITQGGETEGLKEIISAVDASPVVDQEGIQIIHWLKELTFCSYFDAVRCLVPPGIGVRLSTGIAAVQPPPDPLPALSHDARLLYQKLLTKKKLSDEHSLLNQLGIIGEATTEELLAKGLAVRGQLITRKVGDQRAVMARLIDQTPSSKITPKQQDVLDFLGQMGSASVKEICYYCSVSLSVIDGLKKRGIIELYEEIVYRDALSGAVEDLPQVSLSEPQQRAYEQLKADAEAEAYKVTLLYGVTGSGKTQVFIRLIQETVARGRGVIVMVPEISLTPQTVAEFTGRFGERVAVLHSSLSMGERLDQWRKIKDGVCDIVVGTRLAVFAPVKNLGLMVMDEEQEHTYHSESSPRYHAREIAKLRCSLNNCLLLLCSATPSIESYYLARQGKYGLVELTARYARGGLPQVVTVDMQEAQLATGSSIISEELAEEICYNLDRGEQSILLLNRRGYNTTVKCSSCFTVTKCPHCSVPLTYHAANNRLICHYCGHIREMGVKCEFCNSAMLLHTGVGTQRVEQELGVLFPDARVLRMDMDTTMTKHAHQRLFDSFAKGEYDIMIGTQMVAKGLNFPKVTLVGVLSADQSLYTEDFRGYEKTFALLTQVVGRCGRSELPGRAYIQTYTPENQVISLAALQDYKGYYAAEIDFREIGLYPPFCELCCIAFVGEEQQKAQQDAGEFQRYFTRLASEKYSNLPLRVLGPSEFSQLKVAGKYRYKLLIKCKNTKATRSLIREALEWYNKLREHSACYVDFYSD